MADLEIDLSPHTLVTEIAAGFIARGVPLKEADVLKSVLQAGDSGDQIATLELLARSLAESAAVPELVTFTGYVGATMPKDSGENVETIAELAATAAGALAAAKKPKRAAGRTKSTAASAAAGTESADDADAPSEWCVLYLDSRLLTWLLIQKDGIVYRDAIPSDHAPSGVQDVLWVKADTLVGGGSGSLSVEAQFLTGGFTRAGDFGETPPGGGTLAASTGVFCEARSVGCCRPKTPQKP